MKSGKKTTKRRMRRDGKLNQKPATTTTKQFVQTIYVYKECS